MKRLQPKENNVVTFTVTEVEETPTTRAQLIFEEARKKIKSVICAYAALFYRSVNGTDPDYGADETCTVEVSDLSDDIFVNSPYVGDADDLEVRRITCLLDDTIIVEGFDGEEVDDRVLDFISLCTIADTLEKSYRYRQRGLM